MPIDRYSDTSPRFFEPEESVELARYTDITKFLSLLKDEQLFFCRLDKLEDRFEGILPKISRKDFEYFHRYIESAGIPKRFMTAVEIEKEIDKHFELREKLKSLTCINCIFR